MNDALDQPNAPSEHNVSAQPTGVRYGLLLALASVVLGLLSYIMGFADPSAGFSGGALAMSCLGIAMMIAFVVQAIRSHRENELAGFISLGRCLTIGFWVGLVSGVITSIWNYINLNFINTELKELTEASIDQIRSQVEDGEQPEALLTFMEAMNSPVLAIVVGVIGSIITIFIISLIAGAFLKNDPPRDY